MANEYAFSMVIQAGGQSTRMGQDKALMPFLGQPLIERVVRRLLGSADELLITTNHPEAFTSLNLPLVPDLIPGRGALGGLYTALAASRGAVVAVVACDMPFVRPDLLLAQRDLLLHEAVDVVVPWSPEGLEPLHAVYRRETCLPVVEAALQAGERKVISWYGAVKVREMSQQEVALIDPQFRSFININRPEEFQAAEKLARTLEP